MHLPLQVSGYECNVETVIVTVHLVSQSPKKGMDIVGKQA